MTVAELVEKLHRVPQDLEVHVMAENDLIDIATVDLITEPFSHEPFVVIDLLQEDRGVAVGDPQDEEDMSQEDDEYSSATSFTKH